MSYDNNRPFDDEDENDLWDDLDLVTDTPDADDPDSDDPDSDDSDSDDPQDPESADAEDDYYSDPEPKPASEVDDAPSRRSHRDRFFGNKEDDDAADFYDSDIDPEPERQKQPKMPKLDPEDPDYWIEEDSGISSILSTPRKKWKWWLAGILILLISILGAWIWFFRPYISEGVKYGYIKNMERRGSLVKTFEGSMIPYKEIGDPNPLHFEDLAFSVESDSLAAVMKRMMLDCVPVRVEYEVYHHPLPWKGEACMIVVSADSADPKKILPPEFR